MAGRLALAPELNFLRTWRARRARSRSGVLAKVRQPFRTGRPAGAPQGSSGGVGRARLLLLNEGMWEHFAHGADIGIRGRGDTPDQAFAEAARALTAVVTDPDRVEARFAVPIRCAAPDDELLLVEWLNAVIYEMATRRMVFGRFDVHIERHDLAATAWGEPVEVGRHLPGVEPKGATMTTLQVTRDHDGKWLAQTVLDV